LVGLVGIFHPFARKMAERGKVDKMIKGVPAKPSKTPNPLVPRVGRGQAQTAMTDRAFCAGHKRR
jgi:hypothetical protein